MPLIPLRPLLETVDKYHYAQGAFNVNAVAQAKAAIEVHEMFRSATRFCLSQRAKSGSSS